MRKLKSCGVLVVRHAPQGGADREFLLMEHADRLDLPKGHVDDGETELQCALRELEEETSIVADDLQLDPQFRYTQEYDVWPKFMGGKKCRKTLVVFLGTLQRAVEVQPTEHQGFHWRKWSPPHAIQQQTIDPLLAAVEAWWKDSAE